MPYASFPAEYFRLRTMLRIFDIQASLESSFLMSFIALVKVPHLVMLN